MKEYYYILIVFGLFVGLWAFCKLLDNLAEKISDRHHTKWSLKYPKVAAAIKVHRALQSEHCDINNKEKRPLKKRVEEILAEQKYHTPWQLEADEQELLALRTKIEILDERLINNEADEKIAYWLVVAEQKAAGLKDWETERIKREEKYESF